LQGLLETAGIHFNPLRREPCCQPRAASAAASENAPEASRPARPVQGEDRSRLPGLQGVKVLQIRGCRRNVRRERNAFIFRKAGKLAGLRSDVLSIDQQQGSTAKAGESDMGHVSRDQRPVGLN